MLAASNPEQKWGFVKLRFFPRSFFVISFPRVVKLDRCGNKLSTEQNEIMVVHQIKKKSPIILSPGAIFVFFFNRNS